MRPRDRFGEQWSDRKDLEIRQLFFFWDGHRIGADEFVDRCVAQPLDRRVREGRVGAHRKDLTRSIALDQADSLGQRSSGIDFVVDDDHVLFLHVANDAERLGLGIIADAPLFDERERQIEFAGKVARLFRKAKVRRHDDGIR